MYCTGIDFATRKIASVVTPQKVIEQSGDSFTIKTFTTFKNLTISFKIGEEFEDVTKGMDNRTCKVETVTLKSKQSSLSFHSFIIYSFIVIGPLLQSIPHELVSSVPSDYCQLGKR